MVHLIALLANWMLYFWTWIMILNCTNVSENVYNRTRNIRINLGNVPNYHLDLGISRVMQK